MTIFARVAETTSFTVAGRSLLIDPAAVSRAIKALEQKLGTLLLVRSTHIVKLTANGARFYQDCSRILRNIDDATLRFRSKESIAPGTLTVGMASALTRRMLLRALPAFQRSRPQLEIILLSVNERSERQDEALDVLIRTRSLRQRGGQHSEPPGLVMQKLAQFRFIACASPAYLDRSGNPATPSDLAHHSCIADITMERDVQNLWHFTKSNVRQRVRIAPKLLVQSSDGLREAALAGCGVVRLLACHVHDELRSGALVPILPDWECSGGPPIVAIYRKTKPMSTDLVAFIDHLADVFGHYDLDGGGDGK
jgi:LysR family transcriptional regulator for bpeEF and oprC